MRIFHDRYGIAFSVLQLSSGKLELTGRCTVHTDGCSMPSVYGYLAFFSFAAFSSAYLIQKTN